MKKLVFVTGGTGFIGAQLIKSLLADGFEVRAIYRDASKIPFEAEGLSWHKGDLDADLFPKEVLLGCSFVYHVAAYARTWARDPNTFMQVNKEGTLRLAEAALKAGVQRFLFVSTAGVFGPSEKNMVRDESAPRNTAHYTEYEASKAAAEAGLREMLDLDWLIVHPTRVYGPGLLVESNSVTKIASQYLAGTFRFLPGNGLSIGNYVYVDDVVTGIRAAMDKGEKHQNYILGGENADYRQLFEYMAQLKGTRHKLFPFPLSLMLLAAWFMELKANLGGGAPMITPKWVRKYNFDWSMSSEKARLQFAYQPRNLYSGLNSTFAWLKKPL